MGVVLPRVAFLNDGSRGFRRWFFRECRPIRVDALLNNRRWAFGIHPQYSIALVTAQAGVSVAGSLTVTGPARNESDFADGIAGEGVQVNLASLASWTPAPGNDPVKEPTWEVPLLPTQQHVGVLAKLRRGVRFDQLQSPKSEIFRRAPAAAPRAILYRELDAAQQRALFTQPPGEDRIVVWKGSSFGQFDPHGDDPAGYGDMDTIEEFLQSKRARSREFKRVFPEEIMIDRKTLPFHHARVTFRAVSRATDSRTSIACLVPPKTPLTDRAPYIAFHSWVPLSQAFILGIFNSLPFDWQARRSVETTLSYFILNSLTFPPPNCTPWERIGSLAARLSCVDDRFAEFAAEAGVECGPISDAHRNNLRAEIDALVARAYGLTEDELRFIFTDFTENAVSPGYRQQVLEKFESL